MYCNGVVRAVRYEHGQVRAAGACIGLARANTPTPFGRAGHGAWQQGIGGVERRSEMNGGVLCRVMMFLVKSHRAWALGVGLCRVSERYGLCNLFEHEGGSMAVAMRLLIDLKCQDVAMNSSMKRVLERLQVGCG